MSDKYEKISSSIAYAKKNNIDPSDPSTWDEKYRARQKELAVIIHDAEKEIKAIKEGLDKDNYN